MPQDVAASLRDLPSSTNAKASIRRAAANIVATLGHRPQVLRRVLHPRDRNRHHASLLANQEGQGIMPAKRLESPTSQISTPLV
jgi:hypothetical protein